MTKLMFKTCKEFYTNWIINTKQRVFFFFVYNRFFKNVNWFSIPNNNYNFIPSICLHNMEKNVPLKDFVLVGSGLIIEADDDLSK